MKVVLPLINNVHSSPLVKSASKTLELTVAGSAADTEIHQKILASAAFASGTTTLIISNKEIKNILNTVKFLQDSGLSIKGVTRTNENVTKKRFGFLGMLLGTLVTGLSRNMLAG